jgi:transcriptional regulatory protein LevR
MEMERLDILIEAELIDQEAYEKVKKIADEITKEFSLDLHTESGQMFITHISMAIMRIKNNEAATNVENAVYEEIKESENFEEALRFAKIIEEIVEYEIPKNEMEYLVINGCLLMEQ